jgi:DNA replication protein DnaC
MQLNLKGTDLGNIFVQKNVATVTSHCPIHGAYRALAVKHANGEVHSWPCPKCQEEARKAEESRIRVMQEDPALILRHKQEAAHVPAKYLDYSFGNFPVNENNEEVLEEVGAFIKSDYISLVILGPTGTGKTSLACSCIRLALQKGLSAFWAKESEVLGDIKDTFSKAYLSERDVIKRYSAYDLLVIDEVGLAKSSEYNSAALTEIIDNRSNAKLKTIFLGNMSDDDYRVHFNDQCRSRLHQDALFLGLAGNDMRLK